MIDKIRRLWQHIQWADGRILDAVRPAHDGQGSQSTEDSDVLREFAHVIGSEENWLARLEERAPRAPVWPSVTFSELDDLIQKTHDRYEAYLTALSGADLARPVTYTNSAGNEFTNEVGDILLHVALHGQYHRGRINLLLRQAGSEPAPTDYIAFVRGVPAARTS